MKNKKTLILIISLVISILLIIFFVRNSVDNEPHIIGDNNAPVRPDSNQEILGQKLFFNSGGNKISGFMYKPEGKKFPAILYLHGGSSGVGSPTKKACQLLINYNYFCFAINYPGEQDSEGKLGDHDAEVIAAADAVKFLKTLGYVEKDKIGVIGVSHGAGITLDLVENYLGKLNGDEIKVAVSAFGGVDAGEICHYWARIGKDDVSEEDCNNMSEQEYIQRSPILRVEEISSPLLVIHGSNDLVVPVAQSYDLEEELKKYNKVYDLKIYPNSGHGFVYQGTQEAKEAREETRKWFDKHLLN